MTNNNIRIKMGVHYSISLDTLPETILKFPDKLKQFGIVTNPLVDETKVATIVYDCKKSIRAQFPPNWKYKNCGATYDFYDENSTIRFTINARLEPNDCYAHFKFYTNEEIADIVRQRNDMIVRKKCVTDFIENNFTRKWSYKNTTIVYFFVDGSRTADEFTANHFIVDNQRDYDARVQFSEHKLIGFCDKNDVDDKIAILKHLMNENNYHESGVIVQKELVTIRNSLHRFEVKHMFGYDPYDVEDVFEVRDFDIPNEC